MDYIIDYYNNYLRYRNLIIIGDFKLLLFLGSLHRCNLLDMMI